MHTTRAAESKSTERCTKNREPRCHANMRAHPRCQGVAETAIYYESTNCMCEESDGGVDQTPPSPVSTRREKVRGAADLTRSESCSVEPPLEHRSLFPSSCRHRNRHTIFEDAKIAHTFVDELDGSCSRNQLWISG